MTANELKEIAMGVAAPTIEADYIKLQDTIKKEAQKGLFEYIHGTEMPKVMRDKFTSDGFYVYSKPEDKGKTRINWE